ncbi:hypothetical protein Ciccas_005148, partial [Cichlidogyrus casuarinus]
DSFPGLIPLIQSYLSLTEHGDVDTMFSVCQYLDFISKKASGEIVTTAQWMRERVMAHPGYHQDSVVSESVSHDLMNEILQISEENHRPEKLFPAHSRKSRSGSVLSYATLSAEERFSYTINRRRSNGIEPK